MSIFATKPKSLARRRHSSSRRINRAYDSSGCAPRFEPLENRWMLSAGDLDITFGDGGIVGEPDSIPVMPVSQLTFSDISSGFEHTCGLSSAPVTGRVSLRDAELFGARVVIGG